MTPVASRRVWTVVAGLALVAGAPGAPADDWPAWRGPGANGAAGEIGLPGTWSPDGDNLHFRVPLRSGATPVVAAGRVCVAGRAGEGIDRQEAVSCLDARDGTLLWEARHNVYHTAAPFERVGAASLAIDPATLSVYAHGSAGRLAAYNPDGKLLWARCLTEELGYAPAPDGSAQAPVLDGGRVIVGFVNGGWGELAARRFRTFAFNRRTGDVEWIATHGELRPGFVPRSTPVVTDLAGRRTIVADAGDGSLFALRASTGERLWSFELAKGATDAQVLVAGGGVFATFSERDGGKAAGGIVRIDPGGADGSGPRQAWRVNGIAAGRSAPVLAGETLYVVDDAANLHSIDAATGARRWHVALGGAAPGSPVWADGRLYLATADGRFRILEPGPDGVTVLDDDALGEEIAGAVAVAHGRIYFASSAFLYSLGRADAPFEAAAGPRKAEGGPEKARSSGAPALAQLRPAAHTLIPGGARTFSLVAYDGDGVPLDKALGAWSLAGVRGRVTATGSVDVRGERFAAGEVRAKLGDVTAAAQVRVVAPPPWVEDFAAFEVGTTPAHWVGGHGEFVVRELRDGERVVAKAPPRGGAPAEGTTFIGAHTMRNYTIEADVRGASRKRGRPDVALINSGYALELQGDGQRVQVRSWDGARRVAAEAPFPWEPDTWYRMKLRVQVDASGEAAAVRAKVWPRAGEEPGGWTLEVEDPHPIGKGSPGLAARSTAEVLYDNVALSVNP